MWTVSLWSRYATGAILGGMTSEKLPDRVPASGVRLRLAGVHFDAVRVRGVRGEAVLHHLVRATCAHPGPVVGELRRGRWTYFLAPPGSSKEHPWPPGAACFGPCARDQYVGVPAADGNTYPLSWRAGPPGVGEFVDPALLFAVVTAQLCLPPDG
ncbi:hypothetical protein SSP531S_46280 [Streptomyces spongiicola]|uniref:Uncharacterized protein n=2 Tax=Streptomyces spongiicola TaxID=1690221 RepID=A0A388T323_9ACTN|nr:hypothetical protein SSP531S_46280 [Streptomyces spongiicola]